MNILITRHDKIGDFITMLPVCKVLKEQTKHKIVVLVSKVNLPLAKNLPFIDDVIEYSDDEVTLLKRLAPFKFDISISGYIEFKLGLCLFLARIPKRIAPATKIAQIFFNNKVKQRRSKVEKTEYQYNLDLVKKFDDSLNLEFKRPLLDIKNIKSNSEEFIIFHPGFGGSSDGNLKLKDYISLAKKALEFTNVVFTFGPDDKEIKKEVQRYISSDNLQITIRDDFKDIWELTQFISTSKLFVSTSTGPMHLAGLTNTSTLSFFGSNLFASSKRWATISDKNLQNNFETPLNYDEQFYKKVEDTMINIIKGK